jgi:hypothetical protein
VAATEGVFSLNITITVTISPKNLAAVAAIAKVLLTYLR